MHLLKYCFTSVIINLLLRLNTICAETYFEKRTTKANCRIGTTSDGLQLANCSGMLFRVWKNETKAIIIPPDLPSTIEVLDLSFGGGLYRSEIQILEETPDETVFKHYPKLKRIIQRNSIQFAFIDEENPTTSLLAKWSVNALSKGLSRLNSLEYFEFSKCDLYEIWYPITFPPSLKTLNLSENRLTALDLKMCPQLIEVNVNWNKKLQSVPLFHIPAPPIKTLRMRGCPLRTMTILDIAPLCKLSLLDLEFPPEAQILKKAGYCQCVMLKRWIDHVKITLVDNFNCTETEPKQNCSENIFKEAEALFKKCPLFAEGDKTSSDLFAILKYIFFLTLFLILVAVLILYIIRHFHLREYWAAHHARVAAMKTELPKIEEEVDGEELLNEESSADDYSVLSMK